MLNYSNESKIMSREIYLKKWDERRKELKILNNLAEDERDPQKKRNFPKKMVELFNYFSSGIG